MNKAQTPRTLPLGTIAIYLATGLVLAGIAALFAMILVFAFPALMEQGTTRIFSWHWNPYQGNFGILPMLTGSLLLSVSSLLIAYPVSLALCSFLLTTRKTPLLSITHAVIRFMTAIPTVVYAFVGIILLTPLVRSSLGGSGLSWLTATCVLALLILPTTVLVLESGLQPKLEALCPAGLAVGLTKFELLWFFVFPHARKTFVAGGLLGFGRAIGDTLIPLMLAGNAPHIPLGAGESLRTLTAHMALVTANEVGGAAYSSLFMAGALLLAITALVSMATRRLASA